jgi:Mrp family chromosome partitioning ATPase
MLLDSLFSRRLVVLTGKGGVGKSVVGTALALAARERGKEQEEGEAARQVLRHAPHRSRVARPGRL